MGWETPWPQHNSPRSPCALPKVPWPCCLAPCSGHPNSTRLDSCCKWLYKANPPSFIAFWYRTLGVTSILLTQPVQIGCVVHVQPCTQKQKAFSVPAPCWQRPRKSHSVQVWRCLQSTHSTGWLSERSICTESSKSKYFRKRYFHHICLFSLVSDNHMITEKNVLLTQGKIINYPVITPLEKRLIQKVLSLLWRRMAVQHSDQVIPA